MTDGVVRVAMWSGPRNISTAMMRAWENRPDTWVVDEPLYGHYLTRVDVAHPGRDVLFQADVVDRRLSLTSRIVGVAAGLGCP